MKKLLAKKEGDKQKSPSRIKNWYQDRYETVLIQRNFMFLLVIGFMVIFAFTITGIIELNNTKVYEPFIVQIEESTGIITKVDNEEVKKLPAEKAVRNASLVRYVLARESYNYTDHRYNYTQIVRLMSSKDVYSIFSGMVSSTTAGSPVALGFEGRVDVKIKSITDLDPSKNLVQIRISKARVRATSNIDSESEFKKNEKSYIVKLQYGYRDLNLSETERYINPLGMQVTAYDITQEVNVKNL